jgi:hypothetical protein
MNESCSSQALPSRPLTISRRQRTRPRTSRAHRPCILLRDRLRRPHRASLSFDRHLVQPGSRVSGIVFLYAAADPQRNAYHLRGTGGRSCTVTAGETHQRGLPRSWGVYMCRRGGGIAWPTPPRRPAAVRSGGVEGRIRRSFPLFSRTGQKHIPRAALPGLSNTGS